MCIEGLLSEQREKKQARNSTGAQPVVNILSSLLINSRTARFNRPSREDGKNLKKKKKESITVLQG